MYIVSFWLFPHLFWHVLIKHDTQHKPEGDTTQENHGEAVEQVDTWAWAGCSCFCLSGLTLYLTLLYQRETSAKEMKKTGKRGRAGKEHLQQTEEDALVESKVRD